MDENHNDMAYSSIPDVPSIPDNTAMNNRDWEYSMRREMQEIIPGLFLGPYAAAMKSKLRVLQLKGLTHIVCIRQALEANFVRPNFLQHFRYLVLDICDSPSENIIQHFRQVNDFIETALASGGKVLVHGNGGISRSAAIVIAYVMKKYSLGLNEAMAIVRNQRFCLSVNEGFLHQLMEYEHIYRAEASVGSVIKDIPSEHTDSDSSFYASKSFKRKRDPEEEDERHFEETGSFQNLP